MHKARELSQSAEQKAGSLSGFLQQWARLGLIGISESAIVLLRQVRLKGNEKGASTATMVPFDGRLIPLELEALQTALNAALPDAAGQAVTLAYICPADVHPDKMI